ncbi:30S ribosomal protein S8 [Candidatus Woesearchaeota archaeon]|nr:30S ribosomal protein S8 [Candidatus Woesearchaeota archaeon]
MVVNDPLANTYSQMLNAEKRGKDKCVIRPVSNFLKENIKILQDNNYIGEVKESETSKGKILEVVLRGNINNCNVIKPRHAVTKDNYEKFEKRFLPAKDFGILLVSTSKGLMTHTDAKKHNIGGKLIAYCY